jgi:ComF family protein
MFGSPDSIVNRTARLRLTIAQRLAQLARLAASTLFPPKCCLCGFPGASPDLDLCCFCHADLPWHVDASSALVALRFAPPADDLIRQLKYHGVYANARVLGVLLAHAAEERAAPLPRLLVPVPLHVGRLRERGFNQAAAIAHYAGKKLGIPIAPGALRRVRDTPSQTSLSVDERHRNVRGAFTVSSARALRQSSAAGHVAIVDDVITTGSTVAEVERVLLAAGVSKVEVWAVASAAQARPSFLKSSGGGPSNLSIGTFPT